MSALHPACTWIVAALMVACGAPAEDAHGDEHEPAAGPALPATVAISPEAVDTVGIVLGEARAGASVPEGTMPAELVLDPARSSEVAPLVAGRVVSLEVTIGARVEAGQVLARLASAATADLASSATQARARVVAAQAAVDRLRVLRESGVAAQRTLIEAETELAQARAEAGGLSRQRSVVGGARGGVDLVAPIAGTVVEVRAPIGATLEAGQVAIVIADTARVWAIGRAPERLVPDVREGATARLRLFAFGAERWEGTVAYVAPVVDPASHTLVVRMELDNDDGRLRPGLLGSIELAGRDLGGRVTVPRDALVTLAGADVVFVPTDTPGTFAVTPVAVERRDADEAVIVDGLAAGTRVVIAGAFVLHSQVLRHELDDEGH